jgi:hypothetical protein
MEGNSCNNSNDKVTCKSFESLWDYCESNKNMSS